MDNEAFGLSTFHLNVISFLITFYMNLIFFFINKENKNYIKCVTIITMFSE